MAIPTGQNLDYVKDLIKRYETALRAVKKAETMDDVTKQERLIHPVLKEMQLAIPRVWNDFILATRTRRDELRDGA